MHRINLTVTTALWNAIMEFAKSQNTKVAIIYWEPSQRTACMEDPFTGICDYYTMPNHAWTDFLELNSIQLQGTHLGGPGKWDPLHYLICNISARTFFMDTFLTRHDTPVKERVLEAKIGSEV